MLSTNVQTCATDPCGAAAVQAVQGGSDTSDPAEFVNQACVEGNLGVYCPCFEATITGKKVGGICQRGSGSIAGWRGLQPRGLRGSVAC